MRQLDFVLPIAHRLEQAMAAVTTAAPSLDRLLRRGREEAVEAGKADSGLSSLGCRFFGIPEGQDWPVAPLTAQADGLDSRDGYWLRLDPVYLEPGMGGLLPTPAAQLGLGLEESRALVGAIRESWGQDAPELHVPHAGRWYLHLAEAPDLATTPLDQMAGDYLTPHLPRGRDAMTFMAWVNEAQMCLHAHPLNQSREGAGQLLVNGLWLWGGGCLPAVSGVKGVLAGGDADLQALARGAGGSVLPLPESLAALVGEQVLVVLPPVAGYDLADRLTELERNWFAPLLGALQFGRVGRARLHLLARPGRSVTIDPLAAWRFWR